MLRTFIYICTIFYCWGTTSAQTAENLTTDNGQEIWFIKNTAAPVVTLNITFLKRGNIYVAQDKTGLLKILPNMLLHETTELEKKGFKRLLIDNNIEISFAVTDDNFTVIARCPKNNIALMIKVLSDIFTKSKFPEIEFRTLKQNLKNTYDALKSDPENMAREKLLETTYKKSHPYAASLNAHIASLKNITIDDLEKFMVTAFSQNNVLVTVCGNIDQDEVVKHVHSFLTKLNPRADLPDVNNIEIQKAPKIHYIEADIPQSIIMFNHPGLERAHKDYYAYFMGLCILGMGDFNSRLFTEIREKKGLVYGIGLMPINQKHLSQIVGSTSCEPEQVEKVIKEIKDEIKKIKDHGITQDELDHFRTYLIGIYPRNFVTSLNTTATFSSYQIDQLPKTYMHDREKILNDLTKATIDCAMQRYLDPDKLNFVVVGKHKPS
jgi:zinc protease